MFFPSWDPRLDQWMKFSGGLSSFKKQMGTYWQQPAKAVQDF